MAYVLKLVDVATAARDAGPPVETMRGSFLKSFDVDAHAGRGTAEWTADVNDAIHFTNAGDALKTWNTRSRFMPTRPDGRPNKPLTAFSVEVLQTP